MKGIITTILILFSCQLSAQKHWKTGDSIRNMAIEDMMIRMHVDSVYKKYGKDSQEWRNAWKQLEASDKMHNVAVKRIIEGLKVYPGIDLVGTDASHCFWTLVLHQDKDTSLQKQVVELMEPEVDKKNVEPGDYAYLVDRSKINTGKKQIYGTQCFYDPKKKSYMPHPIEDRKNVDKRRQEVQLPALSEYLRILNDSTQAKFH